MSFADRKELSNTGETEVINYLNDNGFIVDFNGIEKKYEIMANVLRLNSNPASKRLRYKPDILTVYDNKIFYVEVKVSKCMEKDAYTEYINMSVNGDIVLCFFPQLGKFEDIVFIDFIDTNKMLEQYNKYNRFKTDDNGWIYPRQSSSYVNMDKFSGTPYKYIDTNSLKPYSELIRIIKERY